MTDKIPEALAVLDEAVRELGPRDHGAMQIAKARKAFAYLYEASRNYLEAHIGDFDALERIGTQKDLKAALAAVEKIP